MKFLIIRITCFLVTTVLCQPSSIIEANTVIEGRRQRQNEKNGGWGLQQKSYNFLLLARGGAIAKTTSTASQETKSVTNKEDIAYNLLANAIRSRLQADDSSSRKSPDTSKIIKAFKMLSSSQQTFKGLDGVAHETYQRTHTVDGVADDTLISVAGRAQRSAARTGAVADGLFACELCELIEYPITLSSSRELRVSDNHTISSSSSNINNNENGTTLSNRVVLVNATNAIRIPNSNINVSVLVLYESTYRGGAGVHHGGIEELTTTANDEKKDIDNQSTKAGIINGRLLIILYDDAANQLDTTLRVLTQDKARRIPLLYQQGPIKDDRKNEETFASIQPSLYQSASLLLQLIEPQLRMYCSNNNNTSTAIHFTGRSLAGGIASVAAAILNGNIPLLLKNNSRNNEQIQQHTKNRKSRNNVKNKKNNKNTTVLSVPPLQGLGKWRTSATVLGSPPCMSKNIQTPYITSIIHGDDIVCRASYDSIERLVARTNRAIASSKGITGAIIGKQLNWMTDTMSLAASSISLGSSKAEKTSKTLSLPSGKTYLLRPRRIGGGSCSIHEIGSGHQGTSRNPREALRAAILWQLNDILLSNSLWKHHQLDSYIHGLDRVHLRGIDDS